MTQNVILDANVIVSAQLVQHPMAPSFRLFGAVVSGSLQSFLSPSLLQEYLDVLFRPSVARRHGLSQTEVRELVDLLRGFAIERTPPRAIAEAPDPHDQHLWNMLAAYHDVVLVTGDPLLLASSHFPGRILSPRDFVDRFLSD